MKNRKFLLPAIAALLALGSAFTTVSKSPKTIYYQGSPANCLQTTLCGLFSGAVCSNTFSDAQCTHYIVLRKVN